VVGLEEELAFIKEKIEKFLVEIEIGLEEIEKAFVLFLFFFCDKII
jgi:hypothetical protein